ncbi:DISARM system phospholipase D-like protein DrmC [Nocardia sp. XZ_19_231]|uniref:DISARM system phospholipase D-like protein DrmC n=1 Tax=Nocardia sp. XZ_19_231 TaxID=2769252 RepID=UPI00188F13EA|nr:DISARM system phospholipase D-like protein DrmC [Nocardia sp. XZ_19_231]
MDSSNSTGETARLLGRYLTGTEAKDIADRLAAGATIRSALTALSIDRRPEATALLRQLDPSLSIVVLRGIQGARSTVTKLGQLWTLPGPLADAGRLTPSIVEHVDGARSSVICSTFNFQRSSGLWGALRRAAGRPSMHVKVYMDARAADSGAKSRSPTSNDVARHLAPGIVFRTKEYDGKYVTNHAKFVAVDHRFLLVTSANFSHSAEHHNIEFGLIVDNPTLTEAVEQQLRASETTVYERVLQP